MTPPRTVKGFATEWSNRRGDIAGAWAAYWGNDDAPNPLDALGGLVAADPFDFVSLFHVLVPAALEEPGFEDWAEGYARDHGSDLATGPFWTALSAAGEAKPALALAAARRLMEKQSWRGCQTAASLTVGASKRKGDTTPIDVLLQSDDEWEQSAGLLAALEWLGSNRAPSGAMVAFLETVSIPEDPNMQQALLSAMRLAVQHRAALADKLLTIFPDATGPVQAALAGRETRDPILKVEHRLLVARSMMESPGERNEALGRMLGHLYPLATKEVLAMVGELSTQGLLSTILGSNGTYYLVRGIRGGDREAFYRFLREACSEDRPIWIEAPRLIGDVSKGDADRLLDEFEQWDPNHRRLVRVRAETLKALLMKAKDDEVAQGSAIIQRGLAQAKALANATGAFTEMIEREERGGDGAPRRVALRILSEVLAAEYPPVDWKTLRANLAAVPSIVAFIGNRFFDEAEKRDLRGHALLYVLQTKRPTDRDVKEAIATLESPESSLRGAFRATGARHTLNRAYLIPYWEDVFSRLDRRQPGYGRLAAKLRNPTQSADTLCETELLSHLSKRHAVFPEPKVDGKTPDIGITVGDRPILMEVYNPQMEWNLKYGAGVVGLSPQRLRDKILEKQERQFNGWSPQQPLVIAVNTEGTTIDIAGVEEAFAGSPTYTLVFDNSTGQAVDGYESRREDTLHDLNPATSIVSGILAYRTQVVRAGLKPSAYYVPNPRADRALDQKMIDALLAAFG